MIVSRKMRIIHLDDHCLFHAGVRNCLRKRNQELYMQHYQDSHGAFEVFVQSIKAWEPIDLIITDFTHPGQNGYEFAKAVRSYEASYLVRSPILLLTMQHPKYNDFIGQILSEGIFDGYLSKNTDCLPIVEEIGRLTGIRID